MIRTIPSISRLHRVPVPHTNDAVYALSADGGRWIAKREVDMGFEALLSEALSWLLARHLGVPVPDAAFCDHPDERAWLSACVPDVMHWSANLANRIENPREAGAMFTLDAWVLNEARHARNVLAEARAGGSVRIWAIDADEALVGHVDDFLTRVGDVPSAHNHARGMPIAEMAAGAREAALRAGEIPNSDLLSLVEAACAVARETRGADLARGLRVRAGALPGIVEHYLKNIEELR